MEILIIIFMVLITAAIGYLVMKQSKPDDSTSLLVLQKETESLRRELQDSMASNMALINQQLSQVTTQVNKQLESVTSQVQTSTGQINVRMDNAANAVKEVSKTLGELGEATKQVFDVGKDIASLQDILKAPKLRGELGEFFLGDLLAQILPKENYELQYGFKTGARVDAIVKLSDTVISVDSKFPLENFVKIIETDSPEEKKASKRKFIKDVKNRIDEIADSYILPDEGTLNFALMYIPAENVYYETIIKDEEFGDDKQISAYAFSKRVIPVSPNSFYAYLQTIIMGLRGMEVSKEAQTILKHIDGLQNEFSKFVVDFDTIGKHIGNTRNKYEEAQKKVDRFTDKLSNLTSGDNDKLDLEGKQKELIPK